MTSQEDRPGYDHESRMQKARAPIAEGLARQIVQTTAPWLPDQLEKLTVLDVGCGYGDTALALARQCGHVEGIEPSRPLYESAQQLQAESGQSNLAFRHEGIYDLTDESRFDLVVLDNVLEHLHDHAEAFRLLTRALKPGGVLFVIVPNKLWPIEVHYMLPGLSWLPLRVANAYLRLTKRGTDYTDASYAPTYWGLKRLMRRQPGLTGHFVLPADISLAMQGQSLRYKLGVAAIRRAPILWSISKALVVAAVKDR